MSQHFCRSRPAAALGSSLWAMAVLVSIACSSQDGSSAGDVTYHRDVRPVVERNCIACHTQGGVAPFALESYEDVVARGDLIVTVVKAGIMPPWPVDESCHPIADSRRVPDEVPALLASWQAGGFAEGDPADYRPPQASVSPRAALGEPDVEMRMGEPYTTDPAITDNYRCFLLPGNFERDTYVRAIDIRPDQRDLVHHVQIHTIPEAGVATALANDSAIDGPGYTCFGGPAVTGSKNVYSWRPGAQAVQFPPGDALLLSAGTHVVIQVHYNLHENPAAGGPPADQTSIAFWTLPEGELPDHIISRRGLVSLSLSLPPGESSVVTEAEWPASLVSPVNAEGQVLEGEIIGQSPHMHFLGTRLHVTRRDAAGSESCLVDVPHWNFEWQMDYFYPDSAFEPLMPTDVFKISCEYDNSSANQPVIEGVQQTPRQVGWGEGTLDEMCLNYVWARYDRERYLATVESTTGPADPNNP